MKKGNTIMVYCSSQLGVDLPPLEKKKNCYRDTTALIQVEGKHATLPYTRPRRHRRNPVRLS
jgi:hypothetical protein